MTASSPSTPDYAPPPAPKLPKDQWALHSPASWLRLLVPAILGLTLDLGVKLWAFPEGVPADPKALIAGRQPFEVAPVIPNVLGFITTVNHGAVFGFGQGKVAWFLAFSVVAFAVILWSFATSGKKQRVVHLALGLILAGALGNMYDRAVHGGVRDMLKLLFIRWNGVDYYPYIFNIADVLLCVGVPLLILRWLFIKDDPTPAPSK